MSKANQWFLHLTTKDIDHMQKVLMAGNKVSMSRNRELSFITLERLFGQREVAEVMMCDTVTYS